MTTITRPRRHRGSTLVEVLVSILILSFALLGIAGLMSVTTRYQLGVESRSATTLLFTDMASRLRTTLYEAVSTSAAQPSYTYDATWSTQQATISTPAKNCGPAAAGTCTTAERTAYDLWEVRSQTRRALPQGSLQLSGDLSSGFTVTYLWFDKDFTEHLTAGGEPTLRTSTTCSAGQSPALQQSCCPAAAQVATTPGVRCLNLTFIP